MRKNRKKEGKEDINEQGENERKHKDNESESSKWSKRKWKYKVIKEKMKVIKSYLYSGSVNVVIFLSIFDTWNYVLIALDTCVPSGGFETLSEPYS